MDKNRFDGFTRQLAHRESRRQAIKTLLAGGIGTAAAVVISGEAEAAKTDCCPADRPTLCSYTCTDTIYDEQNCGDCGITCVDGERCYKGICEDENTVHCVAVADCPGGNTECSTVTCKKGVCGVTYVTSGKKTATQIAGDCQRNVCDGTGNGTTIVDNTDKPIAQGECWSGICVDGMPHQNALPSGRKCSNGKCDGAGHCISSGGCADPSTCPGTDTDCATRTCIDSVCGMANTLAGTPTSSQTTGDCQQNVCDGVGGITWIPDDTDVINTHYPEECVETACSGGSPITQNKLYGARCGAGFCDGTGICLDCLVDGDCSDSGVPNASTICAGGYCSYQCIAGYTECIPNGGGCVDTSVNYDHCGVCNHSCNLPNATAVCANGACTILACNSGWANCNNDPVDGCEINTTMDDNNCGSCNNLCASGKHCVNSVCQ